MTKLKVTLTAVFAAIIIAFTCFIPVVQVSAFGTADKPDVPQVKAYDKLYYFSDEENCEERFYGYIQEYLREYDNAIGNHYTESELVDLSSYNRESLLDYLYTDFMCDYGTIKNSFIIFELSEIGVNDAIATKLSDIFGNYKSPNKCKIMFISGTDEQWYSEIAFLDSVDIYFDTDLFYDFMINIIHRAGRESGDTLDNTTFIFDKSLNYGIMENNPKNHTILNTFIIKALLSLNYEDVNNNSSYTLRDVFTRYNVNLLFYIGEGEYYDAVNGKKYDAYFYDACDELKDILSSTHTVAIGTSWSGYDEAQSFIDNTQYVFNIFGLSDLEFYIYNPDNFYLSFCTGYHYGGTEFAYRETELSKIIYDFIMGNDLSVYDNWTGRCNVTYKLIFFGPEGWMIDCCDWWRELDDIELDWDTPYPYNKNEETLNDFIERIPWQL